MSERVRLLEERVAALERHQALADHRHAYRYSKSIQGGSAFWSWTCLDVDGEISRDCPSPSGGTNHRGGIPDHFPADLR